MKKIYFLAAVFGVSASMVAQTPQGVEGMKTVHQELVPAEDINMKTSSNLGATPKAAGDTVWIDQFDDPSLWEDSTTANPAPTDSVVAGWSIGDTVTGAFAGSAANMNTSGDFARFSNSETDGSGAHIGPEGLFTMTYTQGIDLSGVPAPHLEFEQYGGIFIEKQEIQISVDGGNNWVKVADNSDKDPITASGGSPYPRPETRRFNMTSAIGNGAVNDVRIRFFWDGDMNGQNMSYYSYGWFVDNIRIVEGYENDLTINNKQLFSGAQQIPYYFTPASQVTDMFFAADATNNGGLDQTNVTLDVELEEGGNTSTVSSGGTTIASGDTDSLGTSAFTPVATAGTQYNATYTLNQDETEGFPSDNVMTDTFYVTDTVYGVDNGKQSGGFGNFASNSGQPIKIGNQMEVMASGQISSISMYIVDNQDAVGQTVSGQLHLFDQNGGSFVFQRETNFHEIEASDLGGFVTLNLTSPFEVVAGDIILPLASHDGLDVRIGTAQGVEAGIVIGQDAADDYGSLSNPNAVMVRANMNPEASIENNDVASSLAITQYPNPFANETTVSYSLENAAEVSYSVVDMAGNVVLDGSEGKMNAGKHEFNIDGSSLSNGIYFLEFTAGENSATQKLVVNK
ncbi:MAG: T9SS type A sorting domain-containing protein [Bacteroidota bacterium]